MIDLEQNLLVRDILKHECLGKLTMFCRNEDPVETVNVILRAAEIWQFRFAGIPAACNKNRVTALAHFESPNNSRARAKVRST